MSFNFYDKTLQEQDIFVYPKYHICVHNTLWIKDTSPESDTLKLNQHAPE